MNISPAILIVGVILIILGSLIYLFGLNKKRGILFPFFGLLLFASLGAPFDWKGNVIHTFWLPVQSQRSSIFLAFGCIGFSVALIQFSRLRGQRISFSAFLLLLMGFYAAALRFVHGNAGDGFSSIVFAFFTLVPLLFVASLSIKKFEDAFLLLRTIVLVNIAWMGMCAVQFVVNPSYLVLGNQFRFVGLTSNPQHTGVFLAFALIIALWLMLNDPMKKYKIVYICIIGIDLIALMWTGSRTGLGMFLIGICAVFYTKAGRAIFILPVAAIAAYIGMKIVIDVLGFDVGVSRLASTQNTREYAWWKLYTTGMENPVFGVGTDESEKSENSWLFGFAAYGIGMLFLMLWFTASATVECLRLVRLRFRIPPYYRPYLDLIIGVIGMYFAGAILEGYILARTSATLCIYMAIAGTGVLFRRYAQQYCDAGYETPYLEDEEYGASDAYYE